MCIAIKRNIEEILNIRQVMEKIRLTKEQKKRISEVVNRYMRIQRNRFFRKLLLNKLKWN